MSRSVVVEIRGGRAIREDVSALTDPIGGGWDEALALAVTGAIAPNASKETARETGWRSATTDAPFTLTVPFDVARLSINARRRLHWRDEAKLVRSARTAALLAWRMADGPVSRWPVTVEITVRRGRKIDPGCVIEGAKAIIDGLCWTRNPHHQGIIPDDNEEWIAYGAIRQETGAAWKQRPEIVLLVTPRSR